MQNSLVTCCRSLLAEKFTCYLLEKLLVAKNHSLLAANFTRYSLQKFASGKNSVAIRWRSCWLQKITPCSFQNSLFTYCNYSLVTRCKIRLLLVGEVARCEKSRVTRCRSYSLIKFSRYLLQSSLVLFSEVARCRIVLATRCRIRSLLVEEVACCKIRLLLIA